MQFHYETVRAWQQPIEPLLNGNLGLLPMAPLARIPIEQIPAVFEHIDKRLVHEAPIAIAGKLMEATLVLAGLRLEKDAIDQLRGRLQTMNIAQESSYYHLVIEEGMKEGLAKGKKEGKVEEAQRLIFRLGQARFGPPDDETTRTLRSINDVEQLERMADRLLVASSWAEMLTEIGGQEPSSS